MSKRKTRRKNVHELPVGMAEARRIIEQVMNDLMAGRTPGAFGVSGPAPAQASGGCSVRLTKLERDALIHAMRLKRAVKRKIEQAPAGTQVIDFAPGDLTELANELREAVPCAPPPYGKRLLAVQKKITAALEREFPADNPPSRKKAGRAGRGNNTGLVYQFKITLRDSQPPIWRRILVDSHLHSFSIAERRFGDPALLDEGFEDFDYFDSTCTLISEVVPQSAERFRCAYEYDFGDSWLHDVVLEKSLKPEPGQKFPACIDGARACPPEDVGGIWGYGDYLEALANPRHERHAEMLEWGGRFDPEEFDAAETSRCMRAGLADSRD
jgi:hypothetical protein